MSRDDHFRVVTDDLQEFEIHLQRKLQTARILDAKGNSLTRAQFTDFWEYTVRRRVGLNSSAGCGNGSTGQTDTKQDALAHACAVVLREATEGATK